LNFQAAWIDLAWLLPALFPEKWHAIKPFDYWIDAFGLDTGSGQRSSMENNLLMARMFQMLLTRAKEKHIDTAQALIQESEASRQLLFNH
jgi:DNA polymerase-3 subunit epsilon